VRASTIQAKDLVSLVRILIEELHVVVVRVSSDGVLLTA
jgi:hypothetical protein